MPFESLGRRCDKSRPNRRIRRYGSEDALAATSRWARRIAFSTVALGVDSIGRTREVVTAAGIVDALFHPETALRGGIPGSVRAWVGTIGKPGRRVVLARSVSGSHRGALGETDSITIAEAANTAAALHLPILLVISSSGADVREGVAALDGWGRAASAIARCSGVVPVLTAVTGPALSGPALLLGLSDVVVMTDDAFAYISGPDMVASFTGIQVSMEDLGGASVHSTSSGLCALTATDERDALAVMAEVLAYLPDSTDALAPVCPSADEPDRPTPQLADLVPVGERASYDVRDIVSVVADDFEYLELREHWAPQLVTAMARLDGQPVGIMANQPRSMAGTLDIAASQKGARFVRFCDAFNLPIITLVDTPGFLPGKDLEWRGMIRHGAELAFSYAEATVPRISVILRKAYGGAYIVMDSKGLGNDICLAWPTAQVAVMGAEGATQILHRRDPPEDRARHEEDYRRDLLTPWIAAERGYVDAVIDPCDTRSALCGCLDLLATRRERLRPRQHDTGPL